jgi:hypothetical protein
MTHHTIEQDDTLDLVTTTIIIRTIVGLVYVWVVRRTVSEELTINKSYDARLCNDGECMGGGKKERKNVPCEECK